MYVSDEYLFFTGPEDMQASAEPIVVEHEFKLPGEVTKTTMITLLYLRDYIITLLKSLPYR